MIVSGTRKKPQSRHPFSIIMIPDRETIVRDKSMRLSEKPSIRMLMGIINNVKRQMACQ